MNLLLKCLLQHTECQIDPRIIGASHLVTFVRFRVRKRIKLNACSVEERVHLVALVACKHHFGQRLVFIFGVDGIRKGHHAAFFEKSRVVHVRGDLVGFVDVAEQLVVLFELVRFDKLGEALGQLGKGVGAILPVVRLSHHDHLAFGALARDVAVVSGNGAFE